MDDREQTSNPGQAEENEAGRTGSHGRSEASVARIIGLSLTLLIAMVPLIFVTIGWAVGGIPNAIYLALIGSLSLLLALPVLFAYRWPAARHKRLRYLVDEDGLRIRRGVFWRKVIWIPISRVQHTDYSQGPVQRPFGLATLTVHTSGTAGASISLSGLEYGIARRLCHHLRPDRATDAT